VECIHADNELYGMVRKVERIVPPLRMRSNKTLSALEYFPLECYRGCGGGLWQLSSLCVEEGVESCALSRVRLG